MKKFNSVMMFGTTILHNRRDGSDLTEADVVDAVMRRLNNIFKEGENHDWFADEAIWFDDTAEESLQRCI
jgi:hypothetical protein